MKDSYLLHRPTFFYGSVGIDCYLPEGYTPSKQQGLLYLSQGVQRPIGLLSSGSIYIVFLKDSLFPLAAKLYGSNWKTFLGPAQ